MALRPAIAGPLAIGIALIAAAPASADPANPLAPTSDGRLPTVRRVALASVAQRVDRQAESIRNGGAGRPGPAGGHRAAASRGARARAPGIFTGPLFRGLDFSQSGGFSPPDVQLAAGPSMLMHMVNTEGEVVTRQGHIKVRFGLGSFFGTGADDISDPRVIYDKRSQRWFVALMDITNSSFLVGISAGSDPLQGLWQFQQFTTTTIGCLDQPSLGVDNDAVFVTTELFSGSCDAPDDQSVAIGGIILVLNKADWLAAQAPRFQSFGPDMAFLNIASAQSLTSTSTGFLASVSASADAIHVSPYGGTPPSGGFLAPYDVGVAVLNDPPAIHQRGTSAELDPVIDTRISDASWQSNRLYLTANEGCVPRHDAHRHACVRVITIDTARSSLAADAAVGYAHEDDFYGAMRPDVNGILDLIYGFVYQRGYPGLEANTYRPSVGFSETRILVGGRSPSTSGRWGDYFGAAVDPVDPRIVWVAGEYGTAAGGTTDGWSTAIGAISASSHAFPPAPPPRAGHYRGRTSQRHSMGLRVSGRRVTRLRTAIRLACRGGGHVTANMDYLSASHPAAIAFDGRFGFRRPAGRDRHVSRGALTVNGRFALGALRGFPRGTARGTLLGDVRLRSGRLCRARSVRWSAR